MGDAAGHLAQRAQAFLLQHGLLRLTQFIVGGPQRFVQLCLTHGKPHMLAELAQELAFATAECPGLTTTSDQHTDQAFITAQRCHYIGADIMRCKCRRQRARPATQVRLMDHLVTQRQIRSIGSLEADPAQLDWQAFLDIADHHLEDAAQILPLADRARDVIEQGHPLQLRGKPLLGLPSARIFLRQLRSAFTHLVFQTLLPGVALPGQFHMGTDPREQLPRREGLHQVVVGTTVQPLQRRLFTGARREQDDR